MLRSANGSIRLFRVAGIDVFLHWSWLVVALIELQYRTNHYRSQAWNIAEYLALFGIVLLHEFGHALACRQVGGTAHRIVLWPLGGVAFVSPPPRPGALLWSIAAGPLVNVALIPVTVGLFWLSMHLGWHATMPDAYRFCLALAIINGTLLVFNLLPFYPLDGGQILQALLWFVMGQARSLLAVSILGLLAGLGVLGLIGWEVFGQGVNISDLGWLGVIALFTTYRSWIGFQQARMLAKILNAPRHREAMCPSCGESPRMGAFRLCPQCRT
ncbi:MAG: site-2 protease family protein, partial [Planctomycetes bacterium]|nr:site-2 protease family protein [Planctomycetota bacterium]